MKEKVFRIECTGYRILNDFFVEDFLELSKRLSKITFLDTYDCFRPGSVVQLPNGNLYLVKSISYQPVLLFSYLRH